MTIGDAIGQVDTRHILGKVIFRLFSASPFGTDSNPLLSPYPSDN